MVGTSSDRPPRPGDDAYPQWAQEHAADAYRQATGPAGVDQVTCPNCGHVFDPAGPVRVTESAPAAEAPAAEAPAAPYGDVEYADPGLRADGKKRYPVDTKAHARAAWSYINQDKNAAQYSKGDLSKIKARIKAALKKFGVAVSEATEAMIDGKRSYNDTADLVRDALRARARAAAGIYVYVWVADLTDTDVVYADDLDCDDLWQCSYSIDTPGNVTLGEPSRVVRTYAPAPTGMPPDDDAPGQPGASAMMSEGGESEVRIILAGRVLEAKGTAADGGRIFRSRIIAYGDSANGRRYPEAVMRAAAALYEGTRSFDGHRSKEALASSSTAGLVGYWRNVEATDDGLEADLYLLPSAGRVAEALDASLTLAEEGLAPLIGVSHDVMATFKPIADSGRRLQEATAITRVLSADVVADPAAGGKPVRAVAGGVDTDTDSHEAGDETPDTPAEGGETTGESDMTVTADAVLGALQSATPEQLAAVGLQRVTTESAPPPAQPEPTPAPEPATEAAGEPKTSYLGKLMIRSKVEEAGLPAATVESLAAALPDRITEGVVDAQITALKAALGVAERSGLVPTAPSVEVVAEAFQKKLNALDKFFAGKWSEGYHSFRQAYEDITGRRNTGRLGGEDYNRQVLRESLGAMRYDSARRASESLTTSSWDVILGDSITRRMIAEYVRPNLGYWRQVVSSVVPVNDFRTQRIDRLGGYGTLPTVNQGAPYQPLTSPSDEEITYAITKKGGTEDLTLEMIADDDVRAISNIPRKLGLAAAQTLYRFVFDIFPTNAAVTYDSTALFHTNHANTTAVALSQSALSGRRAAMRGQTAYGDSSDVLSFIPKLLIVPSALEELAFQLTTSRVAVPSTAAGPSDTPNINEGMGYLTIDYYSDTNDWYLVADPAMCPTIEIGFYQGREDPELFTQADPTVGSMFDADKITWKIRHIYSGAVLDHRAFQRGTQ